MITYTIPEDLKQPVYQYLYRCIRRDIELGKLQPNEKLPSKRNLAKQLQLSLITIENAYSQLCIEGYVTSIEKKGYYVNAIDVVSHRSPVVVQQISETKRQYQVDLTASTSQVDSFPFASWSKIARNVLSMQREQILQPCEFAGVESLRKAIASHLSQYMGFTVSYQQIVIGAGSEYLYSQLVQLFGKSTKYALEDPGHQTIAKVYKSNEVDYAFIALDQNGIDVNQIVQSKARIVHVSPNHHYPTGICMPISRRQQLLKWADAYDGYIIEDDYDSEFRLKGKPIPPLFDLDHNGRVVYMNTFSISLSSSMRLAYMVLPQQLLQQYQQKMSFYHCTVPTLEQLILAQFISTGGFERHINRMRKHYKDLRDLFVEQIKRSSILKTLQIKEADSGLHLLLVYPEKISDQQIEKEAGQMGLHIYTLSHFMNQPRDSQTIVIRYTGLDEQKCHQAIILLEQLFNQIRK